MILPAHRRLQDFRLIPGKATPGPIAAIEIWRLGQRQGILAPILLTEIYIIDLVSTYDTHQIGNAAELAATFAKCIVLRFL